MDRTVIVLYLTDAIESQDGGFLISGLGVSQNNDIDCNWKGSGDFWLAKLVDYNSLNQTPHTTKFLLYPNPANNVLYFKSEVIENGVLILYNSLGDVCMQTNFTSQQSIEINTANLSAGFYLLQILTTSSNYSEKIIVSH